jgi:hypothetical protein
MASALFAAQDRSPAACRQLAQALRLDMKAYDRVVLDPATDSELYDTVHWVRATGLPGLPLVWIQEQVLQGVPSPQALRDALRRAERSAKLSQDESR